MRLPLLLFPIKAKAELEEGGKNYLPLLTSQLFFLFYKRQILLGKVPGLEYREGLLQYKI